MTKRKAMILFATTAAAAAFTGCSKTASEGTLAETESRSESAAEIKTELAMWGNWGGDSAGQLEKMLEEYNHSQDQYHITYMVQDNMEQKLLAAATKGDVPDVVLWDRFNTGIYASRKILAALDDYIAKDGVDMSNFYAPAVDEMTLDGTVYGVPLTVDSRILFYNKDLLQEANVDPASITDWDSLRDAAVKLTKWDGNTMVQAGFSLNDAGLFNNWIGQAGGKMVNDGATPPTAAFHSEAGLAVLDYWDELLNKDKVYQLGFEDAFGGDGFKAGKVALAFNGPWSLESYHATGLPFGVIGQPEGCHGEKSAMMGGWGLVIPSGAKNPEAAWDFMKWWTLQPENGVEFCKISGNFPANKTAAKEPYFMDDEIRKVFSETMDYAAIRPKTFGYSEMETIALTPQLRKYVNGEISAEEALSNAESQGNDILSYAAKNYQDGGGTRTMGNIEDMCELAQDALWSKFWNDDKQVFSNNYPKRVDENWSYWWQAHALDALLDGYARTNDTRYMDRFQAEYKGILANNGGTWLHNWYDDMEWMTLAFIRAFDLTGEEEYLNQAVIIWNDIKTAWNDSCGGGMAWKKDQLDYKNTPANGPAAIIAFRLYQRLHHEEDLEWGEKILKWTLDNLVDPETGFVWDGMNREGDGKVDYGWKFTYCQGVVLGAALECAKATGNEEYLELAGKIARRAVVELADSDGIFPYEGADDCGLFRGIYFRYLYELTQESGDYEDLKDLIKKNARMIAEKGMNEAGLCGGQWGERPIGTVDLAQHLSAVMTLEMAAKLQ